MDLLTNEQLTLLKTLLERRLAILTASGAGTPDDADGAAADVETSPLDRATVRLLKDLTREAADHHASELHQVRRALARFADDSYGLCEECGQPIGTSRLLARPEARLCIACQTRAERHA
jgi:DnaK suppressor protein